MNQAYKIVTLSCAAAVAATLVFAQATTEELTAVVEARHDLMKARGAAVGVLAKMAQGEVPYDSAAAVDAATTLVALSADFNPDLWPAGTEAGAIPDSEALPVLFDNIEDLAGKDQALHAAALAMQEAAAIDLAALQAALPAVGGACGACHQAYRVPS